MGTPVLTKKQQSSTLSAKKFKTKQIIRNVLASPYETQYWPEVSNEDLMILKKTLQDFLPRIKNAKVNIPWKQLKQTPRSERKKTRLEYMKTTGHMSEIDASESHGLVLGINDVTKRLENNNLAAVLITSDVQPRLMVQHVIDQSVLNGIDILVVKDLRTLVKEKCGITGAALGIAKDLSSNSKLNLIRSTIQEISEHYPVPSDHINYHRSLKRSADQFNSETTIESPPKKQKIDIEDIKKEFYLIRKSKDKRIFVPTDVTKSSKQVEVEKLFQPFSADRQEEDNAVYYKSLKIKRVKSDVNRNKRIANNLKNKTKSK